MKVWAEVPWAADTPHLLSLDPPLTNRLACADIPLQLFNTISLYHNNGHTASPTTPHPHINPATMALKRINKELTDLGRYVKYLPCRRRGSHFCSHAGDGPRGAL